MSKVDNRKPESVDNALALGLRVWRRWARRYLGWILVAIVCMIVVAGATSLYPATIQWFVDALADGSARDGALVEIPLIGWKIDVVLVPPIVFAVMATRATALYVQMVVTQFVVLRVLNDMQKSMFAHLIFADVARLARDASGQLISRFTNDINLMRQALLRVMTNMVRDILTVIGLVAGMFYLDWLLASLTFLIVPPAAIFVNWLGRRMRRGSTAVQEHFGDLTALLNESLGGARMVKTYRLERYETGRANSGFEELFRRQFRMAEWRSRLDPVLEVLLGLAVAGIVMFVLYEVNPAGTTVGEVAGFIGAVALAAQPGRGVATLYAVLQEGLAVAQRVFTLLDEQPLIVDRPGAKPLAMRTGAVALRDVTFGYGAGANANALNGVSLEAPAGKTVALVGPSGAGKSTILNLIPRLYDVRAGAVLIDGQDVRDVTLDSLRDAMALVSQDVVLFDDTVRANIAFGKPGATDAEIEAAARAAAAHDFICGLSEGYETIVGDRGSKLSGGERQRISLARAVLRDAPILLLDEATNALDAQSERQVQQALARLAKGRTTLAIAHRLTTVRGADLIFVLENGAIVEQGAHDDLLAKDGLYARLCRLQFFAEKGGADPA